MDEPCAETAGCDAPPDGLRPAGASRGRLLAIPDVGIRCRSQAPDAPPLYARPRMVWNLGEVSGAVGDIGTFLPHILGAITVVGLAPSGVLAGFGLFYLASGLFYGVPLGVQPMKAASAVMLVTPMRPGEVMGAGLVIGVFFLLAGLTGAVTRLARAIPAPVTGGLQLGLGLSLAGLGVRQIGQQLWLGLVVSALMLLLLSNRRLPAALVGLGVGVLLARLAGVSPPLPPLQLGLHLPQFAWPSWGEVLRGTQLAVVPQVPLTLTNAIIVTAAVTRQLFPKEQHHVSERNLAISTGLGNLLAAPFGGYPMCHGAGGIVGHHRFGARTATAPVLIGALCLGLGLLLGDSALPLLRLVPAAVLGSLLFFSGLELALASKPGRYAGPDLFVVMAVGALGVAANPSVAFAAGLALAYALRRGIVRL
jgi:predicted benzoate:H+ symporter BenE